MWASIVGVSVWAVSFYQAYTRLAIPAFGPPEQASLAMRSLSTRYGVYLAVGVVVLTGLRMAKRRTKTVQRVRARSLN